MLKLRVWDLNKLLKHLADLGYTISEGPHAVLHDGSEVGYWILTKDSQIVGQVIAHYIDNHYYALMKTEGATDSEVIEALIRAEHGEMWRTPVEDVVVIAVEEVLESIVKYADTIPNKEAEEALAHYEKKATKIMNRFMRKLVEQVEKDKNINPESS
ncbi:MAG: hypothetical protein QXI06_02930 [Sulfolobales archaeon]